MPRRHRSHHPRHLPFPPTLRTLRTLLKATVALVMSPLAAASPEPLSPFSPTPPLHDRSEAVGYRIGWEDVHLPGRERMGLLGGAVLLEASPGWWWGPAVYGAARGERGGLFVGGVQAERRWQRGPTTLLAGLFAGGGGGAGAPVGGGLMLRPTLALMQGLGPVQAGVSLSQVRFPSGEIRSTQAGLMLAWDGRLRHADPQRAGESGVDPLRAGLGFDGMAFTVSQHALRLPGVPQRRIGLAGARLERHLGADGRFSAGLEAAGAASGDAAGYMEVLAHTGWQTPAWAVGGAALRAGLRASLGLGGGGAVPTGGGVIGKATWTLSAQAAPGWRTGLEFGALRAADTALRGRVAQWWLSAELEPSTRALSTPGTTPHPAASATASATSLVTSPPTRTLLRTEWTGALQHLPRVARRDGRVAALDTMGLKLNRYLGEHVYLTGQAHAAYAGGAGAYWSGLVGAGWATRATGRGWQLGAEALAGAGGGGGVDSGGGALVQALAWAGLRTEGQGQWRAGVGAVRSARDGRISTPLVELSWTKSWGVAGR